MRLLASIRGLKLALRKDGLGYCAGSGSKKLRGRGLESLWLQKLETSNPIGYGLGQVLLGVEQICHLGRPRKRLQMNGCYLHFGSDSLWDFKWEVPDSPLPN